MGIREPIFIVAFCWSAARTRGFCRMWVLLSVRRALAVAWPTVTAKSFEVRCARLLSVRLLFEVVGVQSVLPVGQVVVLVLGDCSCTLALEGHEMPRLRSQFLLTSR